MAQWTYVKLPCPFGGPQCQMKICRNGITQLIENTADPDNWASNGKALALLKERMANHVIGTHDLLWAQAMEHVNMMEPQYWTEEAPATGEHVKHSIPVAPRATMYLRMTCPVSDKINKTCWCGLQQVVGDSVDMAISEIHTRMASHLTEVHGMTWEHACERIHCHEVIVGMDPYSMPQDESSDCRHRSRSPRGCKGGSGCASGGGGSSGSASGGKDGKGGTGIDSGKAGKGGKGGIIGTTVSGLRGHHTL